MGNIFADVKPPQNIFADVKPQQNIFADVPQGNIFADVTPPQPKDDRTFLQKAEGAGLKVAGYGLKGFELLNRPWSALMGMATEGAKSDKASAKKYGSAWNLPAIKAEASAIGSGAKKGITGQETYGLSDVLKTLAPSFGNVHPFQYGMQDPATMKPGVGKMISNTLYNASLADALGLVGDIRGTTNVLPSIGGTKMVATEKVVKGSGKAMGLLNKEANAVTREVPVMSRGALGGMGSLRIPNPTQKLSNIFGQIGTKAEEAYNAARRAPVAGRKELVEYVYKGLGGEGSGIAKRELQHMSLGDLQDFANGIAETAPRPTMEQIASEMAAQQGVDLPKLLEDVSNPPTLRGTLLNAAERSRMARAAGVSDAPPAVRRLLGTETVSEPSPTLKAILERNKYKPNPTSVGLSRTGLGMKMGTAYKEVPKGIEWMGKELVSGEKLQGATKALTAPIRNNAAYQAVDRAFHRIPESAPPVFKKFVWNWDKARNVAGANSEKFAKETGVALKGLTSEERKLVTHAVDQGLDLSKRENVVKLIGDAGLNLKASSLDLGKLKKAQDYATTYFGPSGKFASEELRRGILDNVKEQYVPYLFDRSNPKAQGLVSQAAKRGAKLSENHPFKTRDFQGTLADAKKLGIPIKTEDIGDLLAVRGHAHFRAVANHDMLEQIKGMKDLVTKGRSAPMGWLEGDKIAPQLKGYWVNPDVKRFLEAELSPLEPNSRNVIRTFYDTPMSVLKTLYTRINPGFHGRNYLDNRWKNFLAGVDQSFAPVAKSITKGAEGTFVTKAGEKIPYSQIRSWIDEYGLSGFGWFGSPEDLQTSVQSVIKEAHQSNAAKVLGLLNPGQTGQKIGNAVETNAKVTHFLDRLYKYGNPDLAAQSVNKFLFNYGDLTPFERNYMKRLMPFYTFRRKNVPLMYQQLLENPGKFAQLQVAKNAAEGSNTAKDNEVPDYMKQQFSVDLGKAGGKEALLMPGLSVSDLQVPFRPLAEGYGMLTPAIRLPVELYHNKTWYGGNIDNRGGYQTKELPGIFNPLASVPAIRDALGIKRVTTAKGVKEYRIPAKARYVMDSLMGSTPRDIGKMFEQGTSPDFLPTISSFLKWVDTEQQRQYNKLAEREKKQNKVLAQRDEKRGR